MRKKKNISIYLRTQLLLQHTPRRSFFKQLSEEGKRIVLILVKQYADWTTHRSISFFSTALLQVFIIILPSHYLFFFGGVFFCISM